MHILEQMNEDSWEIVSVNDEGYQDLIGRILWDSEVRCWKAIRFKEPLPFDRDDIEMYPTKYFHTVGEAFNLFIDAKKHLTRRL